MRVFEINTVFDTGSTGRITAQIKRILEKNGHECFAAYGRGKSAESNTMRIGNTFDLYFHALATRITDRTGFYSASATKELIKKIREFAPDIIQLHNLHGYYIDIEFLFEFLKEYNKPVVWTLHDAWALTGHCAYFDYAECEKWKTGCFNCPQKKQYPSSFILDMSEKNYCDKKRLFTNLNDLTIVTPSEWLASVVRQSFFSKYSVKVIENGIDLNSFYPVESDFKKRYNIEGRKIILGVANGFGKRKGFDDFIKLSETLDRNYIIVMVGLSDKQIKILPEGIIGIPKTGNIRELAEIYSAADVFVNCTYEEVLGMTNLEALACGTPVITYNSGGSPETITEKCGIAVNRGDIEAVADAVEKIDFSSEECIKRAKSFNMEQKFQQYVELYNSIIHKSKA